MTYQQFLRSVIIPGPGMSDSIKLLLSSEDGLRLEGHGPDQLAPDFLGCISVPFVFALQKHIMHTRLERVQILG